MNQNRRRMLGAALAAIAATQLRSAAAAETSFGALKQIDAGQLNVGYAEAGPAGGRHNLPQEVPGAFAEAIVAVDGFAI